MKSGYLRAFMGINTFKNYFQYEKDICGCLWVFILLKIIVSMKKGYVDVWGMGKNVWGLYVYFFKVVTFKNYCQYEKEICGCLADG